MRAIARRIVAAIVDTFPSPFRERFGAEMLAAYLDQRDALRTGAPHPRFATLQHDVRTIAGLWRARRAERRTEQYRRRALADRFPLPPSSRMQHFLSDARHTLRVLRTQPGFVAVAILTLATGIGANTAVFSVLNRVVLSPLPYQEPEQLVRLYSASATRPDAREYLNGLDLLDVRDEASAFSSVGIMYTYRETGGDLMTGDGQPERVPLLSVSADYFTTLGATPLLGRTFTRDEERPDARRVILSHTLWGMLTDRDPGVIGRTILLGGESHEVVGVMRPGFTDVTATDIAAWVPQNLQRAGSNSRQNYYLSAIARLKPGVTRAQAQAHVDAIMQRLNAEFPTGDHERRMHVVALHEDLVGDTSKALYILMGAAGLVLLIACLNVANLFLARGVAHARETAIRAALGANRSRLLGQRLTESLVVAAAGGVVGTVVAYLGVRALLAASPASLARAETVRFDPVLLGFAILVTMLTGVLFGAAPAVRASRADPSAALHDGARGNTGGRASRRSRNLLVASQVSLALILLVGAGVLIRAFVTTQRLDLGFAPAGVATFEIHLPGARYEAPERRVQFHTAFLERLGALPGVASVGATSWLPANGRYHEWGYLYLDKAGERQGAPAQARIIDGEFLSTFGIPLLAGRGFTAEDRLDTPKVALISRTLATRVYGDDDPVGREFRTGGETFTVVGVTGDVATEATGVTGEVVYINHDQFADDRNWALSYAVRSDQGGELVAAARRELAAIDPALVLYNPRTMESVLARHRARDRFVLLLMTTFGAIALTLAAVGVYGVLSYLVTQRHHEIGVRMALGARATQVRATVMAEGILVAGAGIVVGLAGAMSLSGVLQSVTTGVQARDPVVLGGATLVLVLAVLAAGYVPAVRATRVSPLEALRSE